MRRYDVFLILLFLNFCSQNKKDDSFKENESTHQYQYKMPLNPFPSIMEQFYSYKLPVYKMQVKPKSIDFDCSKRNDQNLFWCIVNAELAFPDKDLPNKITMAIPASIAKEDIAFYSASIKKIASNNIPVFLLGIFPFKSELNDMPVVIGKYYGIYNAQECLNWYGYFEDCPKGSAAIK